MQRPLWPQGLELSRKAGASSAGQTPIDPAAGALEGISRAYPVGGRTQAGVATKFLSRGEALDAVDLADDHGGQDWSHTG